LLRGGRVVVVLLGVLADQVKRGVNGAGIAAAVIGGACLVAIVGGVVSWLVTRYRVEGDDLRIESGLLVRRSRRVPLARLQAIDIVRPLLGRAFGLAELKLEVVGQGKTEAPLAYLGEDEAIRLRARLLALSAGWHEETPTAPAQILVRVPAGPLVASTLLTTPGLMLFGMIAALVVVAVFSPAAAIGVGAASLTTLFAVATVSWRRVSQEWDFALAESPDGLRLHHGLLETRAQTIPPGRIQALRLVEPVAWRPFGWVRVEVDVAGYQSSGRGRAASQRSTSALLPVAPPSVAHWVIARITGVDMGTTALSRAPRRARWRAPLSWHNLGVAWTNGHAVTRGGFLTRVTDVVPETKFQSLRLVQGPLQRRLRLASVRLDTAGRRVRAAAAHRDRAEAERWLEEGAERARHARAADIRARIS
jgi:putative membrane protein